MNLRLQPLYQKLLLLTVVLGPIVWLTLTEDGQRRTDLVLLHLLGKVELDLAIEQLHSEMTEARFRELFPDLALICDEKAGPFGDRFCIAEIGAFNAIPARSFTLFLRGDRLRAAKLDYRPAYHETLKHQLTRRLGRPDRQSRAGSAIAKDPLVWKVSDGLLLLAPDEPELETDAALMWLSEAAVRRRIHADNAGR